MKILIIDEEFPWPLDSGKRIRTFNLVSRLASHHEIRFVAYGDESSGGFNHLVSCGITPIAVPARVPRKSGPMFYLRLLKNVFSPWPYIVSSHYSRLFARTLEAEMVRQRPDIVTCEWSPYARYFRELPAVKRLVVTQNIEHLIWQRYFANESNPVKRWYIGHQMRKVERFEREVFAWADGAVAVSEAEAETIRQFAPGLPVTVVENGVNLDYFAPQPLPDDSSRLVFVGSMDWRPNQDAVRYFINDILPAVERIGTRCEIDLIGRHPPRDLMALKNRPGVNLIGHVDDVRPFVANAAVFVVPLRIGGGTRIKILEALAMKKAVVSTSVGAEGLKVTDGENILLADTPVLFAEKIKRLLDDRALNRRLGENGRRLVEEHYGWDRLAAKLNDAITDICRARG
ncbi:MAG: glycosyltransferase family 4 protein [Candidatus Zixiibacteriota bacterium]